VFTARSDSGRIGRASLRSSQLPLPSRGAEGHADDHHGQAQLEACAAGHQPSAVEQRYVETSQHAESEQEERNAKEKKRSIRHSVSPP